MLDCERALAQLNDFQDGTLSAAKSVAVSAHLERCLSCRDECQALKATRVMLRAAAVPSGDEARDRVLARFRRQIGARPMSRPRPRLRVMAPIGAGALAAAAAVTLSIQTHAPTLPPTRTAMMSCPDTLPSAGDLARMSTLHNLQTFGVLRNDARAQDDTLGDASLSEFASEGAKHGTSER